MLRRISKISGRLSLLSAARIALLALAFGAVLVLHVMSRFLSSSQSMRRLQMCRFGNAWMTTWIKCGTETKAPIR
ncbi:hypothetical protein CFB81_25340 [Burkholderia sp. AU28863]|nr:hypothetical protein CFB81_25340 [Burkholderia sp. AU28863]